MVDSILKTEQFRISRVRQFGLYPLWTSRNLQGFVPSEHSLLFQVIEIENTAYNGETLLVY